MLNKAIVMGRLTRDPEIRVLDNGNKVASFAIACDRDYVNKQTNERETDFINVNAWLSTADFVSKYFSKGSMAVVVGRLQTHKYTDKDGNSRIATDIKADNVYFGDSKKSSDSSNPSDGFAKTEPVAVEPEDSSNDELPF